MSGIQLAGQRAGLADIALLAVLLAAAKQDDQHAAALRVVHPVAGAMIDLEFAHATGKGAVLARVAAGQPVDPDLDAEAGVAITQGIEPCFERVGLPDLDHCTMLTTVHGLSTRVNFRGGEAHTLPRMEAAITQPAVQM